MTERFSFLHPRFLGLARIRIGDTRCIGTTGARMAEAAGFRAGKRPAALGRWSGFLAVVVAQLVFWTGLIAAERAVRPEGMQARDFVEFTIIDDQGQTLEDGRRYRAPHNPAPNYSTPIQGPSPLALFDIPFRVETTEEDQALYLSVSRSIHEVRLNGDVIQPNVPLDGFTGAAGWQPAFYVLPADLLRPGINRISARVQNEGYSHVFPEFAVAPAETVAAAYEWGVLLNLGLPTAGIGILLFAAMLCVIVNWPVEDRRRMRALVALLLVWALRDFVLIFEPPFAMPMPVFWISFWALSFAMPLMAARYVLIDAAAPESWVRWLHRAWVATIPLCFAMPVLAGRFSADPADWARFMTDVELWLTLIGGGGGMILLARALNRSGGERLFERLCLMICLTALMVDAVDNTWRITAPFLPDLPLTFYAAPLCGLVLGLGMCAALAAHAGEARRVVITANETLASRLAEREGQLAVAHEREVEAQTRQSRLEERQRIVRDMHDGIGGQLVGLILQVRGAKLEPEDIERSLQASVADLRLIVDSLDTADDQLSTALTAFEHRVRSQIEAAGVVFRFQDNLDGLEPRLSPRQTLQILRILQEAVTNALRHAQARTISLFVGESAAHLILEVHDDGRGLSGKSAGGRGLVNMQTRAAALGGRLEIKSGEAGTEVCLILPPEISGMGE